MALIVVILAMLYRWFSVGHERDDWSASFLPAARAMIDGRSPYGSSYYNAPWGLLPFLPLAFLPYPVGRAALVMLSIAGFTFLARRLTEKRLSILLFMTSVPVIFCLSGGNLDWLPMLALVVPAPFALILAAIKPQVGIGIMLYWLIESWRQGGPPLVIKNFLPVFLLFVSSCIVYGFWPLHFSSLNGVWWNFSLFPYTLPLGVFLFYKAMVRKDIRLAMPAGLLFSPYFAVFSLSSLLVGLLEHPRLLAVAWLVTWVGMIILALLL